MPDVTIENLQAELESLRTEFREFRDYALPVVDGHQPLSAEWLTISNAPPENPYIPPGR